MCLYSLDYQRRKLFDEIIQCLKTTPHPVSISQKSTNTDEYIEQQANRGNAEAQYQLGYMYSQGYKGSMDYYKAVEWWSKAAERGHIKAQVKLGDCYEEGLGGLSSNINNALKWWNLAAAQGDSKAKEKILKVQISTEKHKEKVDNEYDDLFSNNRDELSNISSDNKVELVKAWKIAAEQGDANAQYKLGLCYKQGFGVNQNASESVKWWKLAVEQNNSDAMYKLALCYKYGKGIYQSENESIKLLERSALLGNRDAKRALRWIKKHKDNKS